MEDLSDMKYAELQKLAKKFGIKANMKVKNYPFFSANFLLVRIGVDRPHSRDKLSVHNTVGRLGF